MSKTKSNTNGVALLDLVKIEAPPKYTQRRIVWNKEGKGGTAILLVGYCPDTLPYFLGLALDLKARIPEANIQEATCAKVSKSMSVYGFTLLMAPVPGEKRVIKGFDEWGSIDFNY